MEKVCIELKNIEVSFYDRLLFEIPRLAIHQFDRIGIVGKNGAGKSTLLKLMAGQIVPDKGQVSCYADIAYFEQLNAPEKKDIGYKWVGKLEIPQTSLEHLSGGEQTRMKLAQLFSSYHECLFIDEPTTHLDASGVQVFIEEITHYYGALVLVSHDRDVLDKLVTKIWEIEDVCVTEYTGNYSEYVAQKELEIKQQQEQYEKYVKEKNRLMKAAEEKMKKAEKITHANGHISKKEVNAKANKMFMTKSRDTGQKGVHRAAKALEQRVEQLEIVEAPKEEEALYFPQPVALQLHNKFPVMADCVTLMAGKKTLLHETSFQFPLGSTIAITGNNGCGKTTLLRHILQRGEGMIISPKAVMGSYEQMAYQFDKAETVLGYIKERSDYDESTIRTALHAMNFIGNDLRKNVKDLSGGEAIRFILCQLFLGRYNILLLDEPTNFLDLFSIEALERFLQVYEGTVILVSHDRTFVDRVAGRVYVMENHTLKLIR